VRRIEVLTLDELDISGANILLKVDVQGAEVDVLKGGTQTLKRVGVLWLELPFMGIYDGGCSVAELFSITEAEGKGASAARNAAFLASNGKWIMYIDADDIMLPGSIRAMMTTARSRPNEIVFCLVTTLTFERQLQRC
jgi:cellulose synthase/poly-beta-1,6-N-acetylglucosamine synthase-like glycosyltransferase